MSSLMDHQRREHNPAIGISEAILKRIADFEGQLTEDEELAVSLPGAGDSGPVRLVSVKYSGPSLLVLIGKDERGRPVHLLQHVSQTNIVLVAVPKASNQTRRIGFITD